MAFFYPALLSIVLLLTPCIVKGQSDSVIVLTNCESLPFQSNLSLNGAKAQVDSIAPLVEGRWYSGAMESVVKPRKNANSIELQLNRQWRGVLFENGKQVATFQLHVKRGYSEFTYKISHASKALHRFPTVGYLQVCPPHLVLFSEDDIFLFERVEKR